MNKSLNWMLSTNLSKASSYLITGFEDHLCLLQILLYFHLNHIALNKGRKKIPYLKRKGRGILSSLSLDHRGMPGYSNMIALIFPFPRVLPLHTIPLLYHSRTLLSVVPHQRWGAGVKALGLNPKTAKTNQYPASRCETFIPL